MRPISFELIAYILPRFIKKPLGVAYRKVHLTWYRIQAMIRPGKWFCPCCGVRIRSFREGLYKNYPENYNLARYEHTRQDVICPACDSMPRHRILAIWCEENLEMLREKDLLYFAPEFGMQQWMKRNKIRIMTADLNAKTDLKLDIQATGLPNESLDIIFCNHVLEHVEDFRKALKEMYRILRPEGHFVCSFPMDPNVEIVKEGKNEQTEEEQKQLFGQNNHRRVFGMQADLLLMEVGFGVKRIDGAGFSEKILPIIGPADYDMNILFDCTKRHVE